MAEVAVDRETIEGLLFLAGMVVLWKLDPDPGRGLELLKAMIYYGLPLVGLCFLVIFITTWIEDSSSSESSGGSTASGSSKPANETRSKKPGTKPSTTPSTNELAELEDEEVKTNEYGELIDVN